jgi:glycerol-3-phosphate dehydrogenase
VPPVLNIYGGKITTYRRLAEAAMERLAPFFGKLGGPWTATASLPGGDFPVDGVNTLIDEIRGRCGSCPRSQAQRLVRAYGTRARKLIQGIGEDIDWGQTFGADLTEREVRYLMQHEWAQTAEDVLWRRSKLGLRLSKAEASRLDDWMAAASTADARSSALAGAAVQ